MKKNTDVETFDSYGVAKGSIEPDKETIAERKVKDANTKATSKVDLNGSIEKLKTQHAIRLISLVPLGRGKGGKIPTVKGKGWSKGRIDNSVIVNHTGNLGIVLAKFMFVIDADIAKYHTDSKTGEVIDSLSRLEADLGIEIVNTVLTQSGGYTCLHAAT